MEWFGPDAGKPGTNHRVVLERRDEDWVMRPVTAGPNTAVLYKAYPRADIPPLFNLRHTEFWRQGFIRQPGHTFLLVTLDKSSHVAAFQYQDHFTSATEFQWQSQNQTTQASKAGQSIHDHRALGIDVHLFVRAKSKTPSGRGAPFYYLGLLNFKSWNGDKPITVDWTLQNPVPKALWSELNVPADQTLS
jgi:hypothetical protein